MISKFYRILDSISELMGIIFTVAMVLVIFIQIIWRYFLNTPLSWPEEIARYLFLWGTYIAIAVCMKGDNHLRVTIFPDMVSKKMKKAIDFLCQIFNMVFFFMAIILSIDMTLEVKDMEQMAFSIPLSIWVVWAGISVFCSLIFLQGLRNFYLICTDQIPSNMK